jgi:hypothetical protein
MAEVNHHALRSLRIADITETARARLAATLATARTSRTVDKATREHAARTYDTLTAPNRPRPLKDRIPPSSHLQRVADLFLEARAAGGDSARRPTIYVHQALNRDGVDVSLTAVRGQVHRARVKGLIPTPSD